MSDHTLLTVDVSFETSISADMDEREAIVLIEQVCRKAAEQEHLTGAEVSITIVDSTKIQELNRNYRGLDEVTDVLSFALLDGEDEEFKAGAQWDKMLGDIVLCWERVLSQAQDYGHGVKRELAFLTAHGFLHLLGYDHDVIDAEKTMFARQEEVLSALGLRRGE